MKIENNGNLVLGPFNESTPCLMIVLMNCQTKLRINHLTAVKLVAILERRTEVTHDESVDAGRVKGGLEECKKICFEEPKCRAIGFAENLLVIEGAPTGLHLVNKKISARFTPGAHAQLKLFLRKVVYPLSFTTGNIDQNTSYPIAPVVVVLLLLILPNQQPHQIHQDKGARSCPAFWRSFEHHAADTMISIPSTHPHFEGKDTVSPPLLFLYH
ncbi:hypothetical protein TNCV_1920491 [Trichonephila clavipes]|nr:hypothetical protein TNCV_1920491 [Trichonephila clavipes]